MQRKRLNVSIEICRRTAVMPAYAHDTDAGLDVAAAEEVIVYPQQTVKVPIGIKLAVPNGYEMQIRPRSGLSANTPLSIPNAPATIDAGYRDEVMVLIFNASFLCEPCETHEIDQKGRVPGAYRIKVGDRIAQMVLHKVPKVIWQVTDDIKKIEGDRGGGFGSTGSNTCVGNKKPL